MKIYVDAKAARDGNGSKESPFKCINDAAQIAQPGDEILVEPGIYREYVDPRNGGREDARITYRIREMCGYAGSTIPFSEVITLILPMFTETGILPDGASTPERCI